MYTVPTFDLLVKEWFGRLSCRRLAIRETEWFQFIFAREDVLYVHRSEGKWGERGENHRVKDW